MTSAVLLLNQCCVFFSIKNKVIMASLISRSMASKNGVIAVMTFYTVIHEPRRRFQLGISRTSCFLGVRNHSLDCDISIFEVL